LAVQHGGGQTAPAPATFAYQPALDGVRALAVVLVLLYHAGFGWMSGGYVGVSVFFTLSGFLITSLALTEHRRSGRIDVGAFYGRRLRRIVPASLVCLAGVMIAAAVHQFDGITELRRDLWAALAQVYNWTLLAHGDSYASEIARAAGQRAPLDHYWSLAIEEQFYWVWPLVLLVLLRAGRRSRLALVGGLWAVFVVAAVAIAAFAGGAATYLATPARLPEILLGAVLAVAVHAGFTVPSGGWLAAGALGAVVVCAVTWPASGGPAEAGWLPLFAVASALVIAGLQRRSAVRAALSIAPLVWLGRISYGVYLFHWPVYTLVDERRFPVDRALLFLVRLAITLALATVSYYAIELPVRARRVQWRRVAMGAAAACVLAAGVVVIVPDRHGTYTYVAAATRQAAAIVPFRPGEETALGTRPVRVLVVGDSTAVATGEGLIEWAVEHPDVMRVTSRAAIGCGVNPIALPDDRYKEICTEVLGGHVPAVRALRPDVVVAMVTFRDMEDRQWSAAEGLLTPTDRRFRQHLLDGYESFTAMMHAAGAGTVLFVIPPTPDMPAVGSIAPLLDVDRIEAYRRVLRALPLSFTEGIAVADLATWYAAQAEPPRRTDGVHLSLDGAVEVADAFLVPAILDAVEGSTAAA
jgi:peptidoglycan/LPS O-acetylase OafA/YrhL